MHSQRILSVAILALSLHFPSSCFACEPDLKYGCEYYTTDKSKIHAEAGEFPWTVFVKIITKLANATKSDGESGCGGVIIDRNWILTAANCVHTNSALSIVSVRIVAGAHTLMSPTLNEQRINASSITVHGDFNETTLSNDIALIELESALQFNEFVNLIPIHSLDGPLMFGRVKYKQSGWGNVPCVCNDGYLSDTLMKSNMDVVGVGGTEIWAVGFVGQGDTGGPLISKFNLGNPNVPTEPGLVGIMSFRWPLSDGYYSESVGGPVVTYTRVERFVPWIKVHAYSYDPASLGTTYSQLPAIKFNITDNYTGAQDDISMISVFRLSTTNRIPLIITTLTLVSGIILLVAVSHLLSFIRKRRAGTSKLVSM